MKTLLASVLSLPLLLTATSGAEKKGQPDPAQIEEITRLQVFLDRASFGPGKIDGRGGEFTTKALERYRRANGSGQAADANAGEAGKKSRDKEDGKAPAKGEAEQLDTAGLDLQSVGDAFTSYTVTSADLENIGEVPKEPEAQAKLKAMPYRSAAEAIAERFHADIDFLKEQNPGVNLDALKEGDKLVVPNVEPFDVAAVKEITPGEALAPAANPAQAGAGAETEDQKTDGAAKAVTVKVDTKNKMLDVFEGKQLVAAFPVTPGSDSIPTPTGEWKVKGVARMPDFRYDKKLLKEGERSDDAHIIPPGPNNPVGVIWIALNRPGIGLHGTDEPDSIGRAASHGCVRLANWDAVKLARLVKGGVAVTID